MAEGYQPYLVNNFFSKKTSSEGDNISFDDLRQYGNCVTSIIIPDGSPSPDNSTDRYWYVIQIAFYNENEYIVQIATSSTNNYNIHMRKYTDYNRTWTSWKKLTFS